MRSEDLITYRRKEPIRVTWDFPPRPSGPREALCRGDGGGGAREVTGGRGPCTRRRGGAGVGHSDGLRAWNG